LRSALLEAAGVLAAVLILLAVAGVDALIQWVTGAPE
jgi:hypothetical protein